MRRNGEIIMSHLYVKKPNGLYAVWSTIETDWLADDLTFDQLKHYDMVIEIKAAIDRSHRFFEPGSLEEHIRCHDRTYDDLERSRKANHG